jgi:hypothetical protein
MKISKRNKVMPRIELTDLERKKLADAGRGFMAKHRSAQEIEIAELKNALAMAKQKKTLRDEFAMAAMHVVGANTAWQRPIDCLEAVQTTYQIADAMMQERVK